LTQGALAAADLAGVAKSVSRALKDLEEHLGVQLFHRATRRMNLTDTGLAFYQQCVRILEDIVETAQATAQVLPIGIMSSVKP